MPYEAGNECPFCGAKAICHDPFTGDKWCSECNQDPDEYDNYDGDDEPNDSYPPLKLVE